MNIRIVSIIVTAAAILILAAMKAGKLLHDAKQQAGKEPEENCNTGTRNNVRKNEMQAGIRENRGGLEREGMESRGLESRGAERTMLLTYTTLILKDTEHPMKKYRADLFRPVMIGRSNDNTIVLEDGSVSRRHLRVFRSGALVYAENLSRMNGTLLNGKQLTEPREIMTGSRLQIGKQNFLVEID